ncbi:MAG: adenosine deaminase [Leptospiraceae bacterium]|nr:adenosine deaminase [Leptospiraceae bacterium]MDW7975504.1 adenosine deaminase [Leptospiraceae bacterium]
MILKFEKVYKKIKQIEREAQELQNIKNKIPKDRFYSLDLHLHFDKIINELLNQKLELEQLEIEHPPEELVQNVLTVDLATASRITTVPEKVRIEEKDKTILDFLTKIPKTEIHLHIEACISKETIIKILEDHKEKYSIEEIEKLYQFKNLNEFIKLFLFILDTIKKPEDFIFIFQNLRSYLEKNNIKYAEVFYAPSRLIQNGLDFQEIARTLDYLASECRLEGGPDVKFLVDVSRTFGPENASKNLQRLIKAKTTNHIGIGLGGAELMGPARDFKDVFAQARAEGLHCVAHSGEDDGPWSIWDTVKVLKAERIGHGTSAIQDPDLLEYLRDKQIPIEICLTSNIFTGKYVRRPEDHPVRRYYDYGLMLSINTDDPEIFQVDLTTEYYKLYKHLRFSISEIVDLVRMGVESTFHPRKYFLWNEFQKEIQTLRKELYV